MMLKPSCLLTPGSDAHVSTEQYSSGSIDAIYDFGRLTDRVFKETRYLDEYRFYTYLTQVVDRPAVSTFASAATNLPPLSSDVLFCVCFSVCYVWVLGG